VVKKINLVFCRKEKFRFFINSFSFFKPATGPGITQFQRNKSSTYVLNGIETGAWDFIYNGVYGYASLTFGSLQLKAHSFVEATNGSDNMNVSN